MEYQLLIVGFLLGMLIVVLIMNRIYDKHSKEMQEIDDDFEKWKAKIMVDRKNIHLGHFDNIEEAVKVRREAELKYFKEFAPCHLDEVNKLA